LIAELKPRYNRRSRFPERALWVKLTVEAFPRLSVVREVRDDGATYLGPFGGRGVAEQAVAALHEAFPLRQCKTRLSPRANGTACALSEMGRCGAPCDGRESIDDYAQHVEAARAAVTSDPGALVAAVTRRISRLSETQRYEEAAAHRDRMATFVRIAARSQRITGLAACRELVAARRTADLGWEIALVRHARLAGTAVVARGVDPWPTVGALVATGEQVLGSTRPSASAEETECVLRWLDSPTTRLVTVDGIWASPARGAGAWAEHGVVASWEVSGADGACRAFGRPTRATVL
jgi:DNA polymerase-3 subunit epsilon